MELYNYFKEAAGVPDGFTELVVLFRVNDVRSVFHVNFFPVT